jgi:hypothetical protein
MIDIVVGLLKDDLRNKLKAQGYKKFTCSINGLDYWCKEDLNIMGWHEWLKKTEEFEDYITDRIRDLDKRLTKLEVTEK